MRSGGADYRENRIAKQKEAFRAVFGKWQDSRSLEAKMDRLDD